MRKYGRAGLFVSHCCLIVIVVIVTFSYTWYYIMHTYTISPLGVGENQVYSYCMERYASIGHTYHSYAVQYASHNREVRISIERKSIHTSKAHVSEYIHFVAIHAHDINLCMRHSYRKNVHGVRTVRVYAGCCEVCCFYRTCSSGAVAEHELSPELWSRRISVVVRSCI